MIKKPIEDSLAYTHPEIAAEWDYDKNDFDPKHASKGQVIRVWWKCPNGHSYQARIDHRCSMGSGCPYCAHKKAMPGETDIATVYPEIAAEWDYEHNEKGPEEYLPQSYKIVYWVCPICHGSYRKKSPKEQ